MTSDLSFTMHNPNRVLTLNERCHWGERARIAADWRQAAYYHAVDAIKMPPAARAMPPSLIIVRFGFRQKRRRDPHNFMATVKPIVDGLVDAGLWPDDTPEWVKVAEPELFVASDAGHRTTITVRPLESSAP